MQLFNDEPTLVDELEQRALIKEICASVHKADLPQVLGLHGDWGSGKTSVLHQIHLHLTGACEYHDPDHVKQALERHPAMRQGMSKRAVVWFEAWRYQREPIPVVALLHEIRQQLSLAVRARVAAKKLTAVAVRGALLSIEDLTKKIGFQASKVETAGVDWEREHLAAKLPANQIREQLEDAVGKLVGKGGRLVILIDDLDRCEAEAAYQLLEGLKIYLTLPNCVFVLAMNQRIVEDAIADHIPVVADDESRRASIRKERAAAYVEKLCQSIWRMPRCSEPIVYLEALLKERVPNLAELIREAVDGVECLPPNPRRLKSVANLLARYAALLPPRTDGNEFLQEIRYLLVVVLIHRFHHDLYRRWVHQPTLFQRIQDWCLETTHGAGVKLTAGSVDSVDELLAHLFRPVKMIENVKQSSATPSSTIRSWKTTFPDPAESNVCWAQALIVKLALDSDWEYGEIPHEVFSRYLK